MPYTEAQVSDATNLILNTRDFCGNEAAAIADYCADENISDWFGLFELAQTRADAEWAECKQAARKAAN